VNGIKIAFDTVGNPDASPLLLISGLDNQLISWSAMFCELLVAKGFWIIRFDNRDAGLSTKFDSAGSPNLLPLIWAYIRNHTVKTPYTLEDMAGDAAGLLDALGIGSAHVVGGSLGGMIAQMMAICHAEKVLTLTILSSTAYDPRVAPMLPKTLIQFKPPPQDRLNYIEHAVNVRKALRGSRFPLEEDFLRHQASSRYDRDHTTAGISRQLAAIIASSRRLRKALQSINVPTLVIHGSEDPLLPVQHGIRLAHAIPNAQLHIIEGLGHELPPGVWSEVTDIIHNHAVNHYVFT
jgi:pimeloyl-ACP methyl ester carboxylesterase